jgi:hypothetical protein
MQPIAKIALVKKPVYVSQWALEHPVARFVKLTRSTSAGLLLAQIVFWHLPSKAGKPKLRALKKGFWWVAKSRAEWMFETGLTLEEYKAAIQLLVSRKLVEIRQMPWEDDNHVRVNLTHVRVLDKTLLTPVAEKTPPRVVAITPPRVAGITPPCTTERVTERATETGGEDPASRAGGGDQQIGGRGRVEGDKGVEEVEGIDHILSEVAGFGSCTVEPDSATMTPEPDMRAEDILRRGRQPSDKAALPALWLRVVHESFGGFQKPLTAKERGQLTHLSKALGDRTRPLIEGVVAKWGKFASRVEQARGTSSPNVPTIGFLLKHFDVAVDLLAEPAPPVASVGTSVQLSAAPMVPTPAPAETPHHLTAEELAQMLKELDE